MPRADVAPGSQTRPDPRPSYAQELNFTGLQWDRRISPPVRAGDLRHSPRWECTLWGGQTLGEWGGRLILGYFRDNLADYIKGAQTWDRARIAMACMRNEPIHLLSPDAPKNQGRKLNFARENYQDVIDMLKGVEIPTNTDAVCALIQAVAVKDASDDAEESPLPSVRRAAGQASGRRKRSDTPPEDTPAAKVQKRALPRTVPTSVAAEVQRQAAMLEELWQAQAAEELRWDRREAELKLKIESLAEKCAQQERVITHLLADGDEKRTLIAQQQQLLARFAAGTP